MIVKEIAECNTAGELTRALSPFAADCQITKIKLIYKFDYPKQAEILVKSEPELPI